MDDGRPLAPQDRRRPEGGGGGGEGVEAAPLGFKRDDPRPGRLDGGGGGAHARDHGDVEPHLHGGPRHGEEVRDEEPVFRDHEDDLLPGGAGGGTGHRWFGQGLRAVGAGSPVRCARLDRRLTPCCEDGSRPARTLEAKAFGCQGFTPKTAPGRPEGLSAPASRRITISSRRMPNLLLQVDRHRVPPSLTGFGAGGGRRLEHRTFNWTHIQRL